MSCSDLFCFTVAPVGSNSEGVNVVARAPKSTRRRLPGVTLKPGAVKQARQESGLSLAQVGKGHVTAPAIYLIETGRTRPSLPTLEHIAARTGKPVEFFLADPVGTADETLAALADVEAMVGDGRFTEAIALGESLLDLGTSAHRLGGVRCFVGMEWTPTREARGGPG